MSTDKVAVIIVGFFMVVFVVLLFRTGMQDRQTEQSRFDQCISAGMQWNNGDCLK